jgi:hypothetical protein
VGIWRRTREVAGVGLGQPGFDSWCGGWARRSRNSLLGLYLFSYEGGDKKGGRAAREGERWSGREMEWKRWNRRDVSEVQGVGLRR